MNKKFLSIAFVLPILFSGVAYGNNIKEKSNIYVGMGVGNSDIRHLNNMGRIKIDNTSTSFNMYTGYQFNKYFSVEFGYNNLGKFNTTVGDLRLHSWNMSLVGKYPIYNKFSFTTKAGVALTKSAILGLKENNNTAVYGVGFEYDINKNLSLTTSWNRYHKVVRNHLDNFSIGMKYNF